MGGVCEMENAPFAANCLIKGFGAGDADVVVDLGMIVV